MQTKGLFQKNEFKMDMEWSIIPCDCGKKVPIVIDGDESMLWYLSKKQAGDFIEDWWNHLSGGDESALVKKLRGEKIFFQEDGKWIAIDNSTGDAFVEEFSTFNQCVMWLTYPITTEVARAIDKYS
jgi:hypothetical protein